MQTIAPIAEQGLVSGCATNVAGFSLHAGVMSYTQDKRKHERPWRYITALGYHQKVGDNDYGKLRYQLKTPYPDGTSCVRPSHVIFEPLDFIARLAVLAPKPRVNMTGLDEI